MTRRAAATMAALAVLAPVLAACGGGSKNSAEPLPTAPTLTVPGQGKTPSVPRVTRTETTTTDTASTTATTPTTTQANPSQPSGGAAAPATGGGGAAPDTQQNDQSPPAGSPASKFEQFCKDNPGAC